MTLNINGTTGISGVDGSVSAPALTGTDSNTGITFPSADTIKLSTGGVERMSITNSGVTATGIPIIPSAFRAIKNASAGTQQIAHNTFTVIVFNNDSSGSSFDTNNFYNTSDYKFTPNIAGYYLIHGSLEFSLNTGNNLFEVSIYKNGSNYAKQRTWNDGSNSNVQTQISSIIPLNGSSDYVQIYGWQNSGGNIAIEIGASTTYFEGVYLRPL